MPIYEYQCQECGHELEAIQRLADDPLTECPACGKQGLKKRVSAPSFRLSGGGWYETDFKTGDKKNIAGERNDLAFRFQANTETFRDFAWNMFDKIAINADIIIFIDETGAHFTDVGLNCS